MILDACLQKHNMYQIESEVCCIYILFHPNGKLSMEWLFCVGVNSEMERYTYMGIYAIKFNKNHFLTNFLLHLIFKHPVVGMSITFLFTWKQFCYHNVNLLHSSVFFWNSLDASKLKCRNNLILPHIHIVLQ